MITVNPTELEMILATVKKEAINLCHKDKIHPDAASLGLDMKVRTAWQNRGLEIIGLLKKKSKEKIA